MNDEPTTVYLEYVGGNDGGGRGDGSGGSLVRLVYSVVARDCMCTIWSHALYIAHIDDDDVDDRFGLIAMMQAEANFASSHPKLISGSGIHNQGERESV